jgi:polysaccharide deacetylase 2 family uncharacterized protein YibQ
MKTLAVAAGIVFWTLVLGTAFLAFFPGSDAGEPVAILQIEPATAPGDGAAPQAAPEASEAPPTSPPDQATDDGMDLPPGFGVPQGGAPQAPIVEPPGLGQTTPLAPVAPGGQVGEPAAPPAAPDDATPPDDMDQQGAVPPAGPGMQQAALETTPPPPEVSPLPVPESETGSITLPEVPLPELVEESQYGPLPKVAQDGRRPIDMYARPSRYASAAAAVGAPPRVAILVTGLGLPGGPTSDVIEGLPAPISIAYGAYGRNLQDGVTRARADGHEVLLQIPLEPNNYPTEDPGPHTLLTSLPPEENMKRLQWLMSRYTGYVGVTNHMGAKFESATDSFVPVFEELKRRGLLYVDDGSIQESPASKAASALGLEYSVVSVQIDGGQSAAEIDKQLAKLEDMAKQQGSAIAVVRLKPAAVKQLADWASKLEGKGLVLVPVSAAVRSQRSS